MRSLDSIAHIFSVGLTCVTQQRAILAPNRFGISPIRARLFAPDIELGRPIYSINRAAGAFRWRDLGQLGPRAFGFGVTRQSFPAPFAPKAAFAHAAKSGGGVHQVGAIYPDNPCSQFRRDIQRQIHIFRPYGRCQPVAGVVGQLHGLAWCTESSGHQHRSKDFFLHQGVSRVQPGDQCGGIETAGIWKRRVRHKPLSGCVGSNHVAYRLQLHRIDQRAHINAFV